MTTGRALVLVGAALLLASTTVPAAADPRIGLSSDGRSFRQTLAEPLFDPRTRWVPGDVRSETLWVRNDAGGVADLAVALDAPELAGPVGSGDLVVTGRAAGASVRAVTTDAVLAEVDGLAPGDEVAVEIEVELVAGAGEDVMRLSRPLGFTVTLTDDAAVSDGQQGGGDDHAAPGPARPDGGDPGTGSPGHDRPGGGLAATGTALPAWSAAVAVAALLAGGGLLTRTRRRTS
ncbi:hypothetical protein DT076_14160 [Desertihabitans brevis]|uniref:Gram-positive cocci surface proteins LPxTG domain-containing protein n=1 Tax=Desertihabitans brevis TaxID=2268447 RepID=A0A367YSJ5_9ACTN|nr:hypothetical protein [Desertihabitans brevis]RCK68727.1 hypothetical protein DT076_14160 [Desertihabitans brevis]